MRLHEYLKKVAVLWMLNRRCYIVGTEVNIPRHARSKQELSTLYSELAHKKYKFIIDVCGVGIQYKSKWQSEFRYEKDYKFHIIRGIEVKTSRADYRNGYVQSGCNYNYLLTPKGMLKKAELPPKVGLIEYDQDKFSCIKGWNSPFKFKGLRVIKRPSIQHIPDKYIKTMTYYVGRKAAPILTKSLFNSFEQAEPPRPRTLLRRT